MGSLQLPRRGLSARHALDSPHLLRRAAGPCGAIPGRSLHRVRGARKVAVVGLERPALPCVLLLHHGGQRHRHLQRQPHHGKGPAVRTGDERPRDPRRRLARELLGWHGSTGPYTGIHGSLWVERQYMARLQVGPADARRRAATFARARTAGGRCGPSPNGQRRSAGPLALHQGRGARAARARLLGEPGLLPGRRRGREGLRPDADPGEACN
mmetsp:Transcript_82735/g.255716  ORF Transcript_82735/g.255716 Transcript_82735/m.255716 type:complete len:212 (+) Transcript_82735:599-1234(+)